MVPGYSTDEERALYEPSMLVYPIAHPVLSALMARSGATEVGSMSWVVGTGTEAPNRSALRSMMSAVAPGRLMPQTWAASSKGARDLADTSSHGHHPTSWARDANTPPHLKNLFDDGSKIHGVSKNVYKDHTDPASYGVVTINANPRSTFFRVYTHKLFLPDDLAAEIGFEDLNLRPAGRSSRKMPTALRPAQATAALEWAAALGFEIVDADGTNALAVMRQRLAHSIVAWTQPGRPAQALVAIGVHAIEHADVKIPKAASTKLTVKARTHQVRDDNTTRPTKVLTAPTSSRIHTASSKQIGDWGALGLNMVVHAAVADTARLAASSPVDDDRLRPFQRVAVGRHLATEVGYANVCSPGAGKTVMALEAMRRRSLSIPGYRGLVIAEANVRHQFAAEAVKWFPSATVVTVEQYRHVTALRRALTSCPETPVVVVTSYALASSCAEYVTTVDVADAMNDLFAEVNLSDDADLAMAAVTTAAIIIPEVVPVADGFITALDPNYHAPPTLGETLLEVHWHDLIADEAACLRNYGSLQSKALWALREHADVAVALTGTPISRGLDDLGRIIAWVRRDRFMFSGKLLSAEFDLSKKKDLKSFHEAIGPVILRYDKSEFADELPPMAEPEVIRVKLRTAEKRLADAALKELRRVYDDLVAWLATTETIDRTTDEYKEASLALKQARSAWMGGTQLARMAASDPASLLSSKSAGAALLEAQGLIKAATAEVGSKRRRVIEECITRVTAGERILVFTEFATVARALITDLRASGLRVGEILGGGGKKRDEMVAEFADGHLDVMVATSAGERGLNLQTATTLIHVDLPWSADQIAQRHGRIERMGATAAEIKIVFMISEDTIEERIASIVAARSVTAMQALDTARGIKVKDTDVARTMSGLIRSADLNLVSGKEAALLEITRALLSPIPARKTRKALPIAA
jgi:superfamily II DNA or RNA helicase